MRTWRSQYITIKTHLEAIFGTRIPDEHPTLEWLAVWAAATLNKFKVGINGRTAYEMMVGHRVKHFVVGFGEKVQFKMTLGKTEKKDK